MVSSEAEKEKWSRITTIGHGGKKGEICPKRNYTTKIINDLTSLAKFVFIRKLEKRKEAVIVIFGLELMCSGRVCMFG